MEMKLEQMITEVTRRKNKEFLEKQKQHVHEWESTGVMLTAYPAWTVYKCSCGARKERRDNGEEKIYEK